MNDCCTLSFVESIEIVNARLGITVLLTVHPYD